MPAENFHVKRDHYDHSKAADRSAQKKMEGRVHEAFLKKCKEMWTKGGTVGVMITVNKFSQVPQITKTDGLLVNPAVQNAIGEAMRQKLMESEVNTILASQVVADENSQQPPPQQVVGAGNDDGNVPPIIANVADGPIGSSSQQQPPPQQVVVADESAQQSPSQQDIVADESPQQPPPQQVVGAGKDNGNVPPINANAKGVVENSSVTDGPIANSSQQAGEAVSFPRRPSSPPLKKRLRRYK